MSQEALERAAAILESEIQDRRITAAAILVARSNTIVLSKGFGRLRPDGDSPDVKPDSIFLLASITKPVTACALMLLVDRGQVSLDDPVSKYLPDFQGGERHKIRVRHLLSHTSGLPDMLPDNDALRARHAPLTEFVSQACRCEPSPGIRDDLTARATDVVLPDEQMGNDYHWNTNYLTKNLTGQSS